MKLRSTVTVGIATLCLLLFAPLLGSVTSAGAYPATTCSTLSVSTTNPFPGESITVTGSNFRPNSTVTLRLRPGNSPVGSPTTSATGTFSITFTLPDSTTNGGNYTIVAITGSISSTSCPADPFQTLAVQAETDTNGGGSNNGSNGSGGGGNGGLSITGVDIAGLLALAAGLIGAGVLLNRKRTKTSSR